MKTSIVNTLLAVATALVITSCSSSHHVTQRIVAPQFLKAGDRVAIISMGSKPGESNPTGAAAVLKEWGFDPVIGQNVLANHHGYAGTIDQRRSDLMWALRDPSIKAIIATRGGYGTSMLFTAIPLDTLKRYHKWIVGYSDISSMHSAQVCAGNMSIHGNMCGALGSRGATDSVNLLLRDLLTGKAPTYNVPGNPYNHEGHATGILMGGNLSVLSNIAGSKDYDFLDRHNLENRDIILFLEDVGENIMRVNSMLYQIKVKGIMSHVKGIIMGRFTDYEPSNDYSDMNEMLAENLKEYNVPICFDFPASHDESWNYPMIEGCPVTLDVTRNNVTLQFNLPR